MAQTTSSAIKQESAATSQMDDWHEFIPYHSHYNAHTLVNKNGELLQIIKIDGNVIGSPCENLDGIHASIRASVRHVINKSGIDDKFSFWLHTIRRRINMNHAAPSAQVHPSGSFNEYVDEQWSKENSWDYFYQNEIYLSVLYEGETIPLADPKKLKSLIFPKSNRKACNKYLEEAYGIIDEFVVNIVEMLNTQCSAKRLSLVERAISNTGKVARPHIFYSEPMEFISNIFNLRAEPFPLPDMDLSVAVQASKLTFGFDAIEAKSKKTGIQRFAAMFSLKQYLEMYAEAVDCVMQAPIEFVISQCFNFIESDKALKTYKDQKVLFGMSGDIKLNKNFGITQMLGYNHNSPVDYCANQISIMIMADELSKLDEEIGKFIAAFARLGLILVREDIVMEETFWSQMPGNFEFIRRPVALASENVGGFCRLNRFHGGSPTGNRWGNYLALLPTSVNSPYFFNFHVQDNGHTVIFDFNSFNDSTGKMLEYFLLTKTRRLDTRIILFDRNQSGRLWMNKISGHYHTMMQLEKNNKNVIMDNKPPLALNPFLLEPSNYNKSFLTAWCGLLISPDAPPAPEDKKMISEAVALLYEGPQEERNLPGMIKLLKQTAPALAVMLENWAGKGKLSGIFDFAEESLDTNREILGFDMTPAVNNFVYSLPLFSYLMHRIISSVGGHQPTIIVINEAWDLLENAFFAPRLESLLEMLKEKNVMVIFTTSRPQMCRGTVTLSAVMAGTATQIYLPDDMPTDYHSDDIKINAQDEILLGDMHRQKGDFLLKQNGESIALRAQITEAEDIVAILSNDIKALGSARGKFTGMPKDY